MAYEESGLFVKIKDGVKAPKGFHYMPNGRLMSDADHIAINGYLEQTITSVNIDTRDLKFEGEQRDITIRGDANAVFSIEVIKNDNTYYDFETKTFTATVKRLNKKLVGNSYNTSVKFPSASNVNYTINIIAETIHNVKTKHAEYVEFRNADDSINTNKTTGSNSNILSRILYQDALKELSLGAIAPSLTDTTTATTSASSSSSNRMVFSSFADSGVVIGDKVTGTGIAADVHAIVTKINPDGDNANEIEISVADSASDATSYTFTPPFNGTTPSFTSATGANLFNFSTGATNVSSFTVTVTPLTGRTLKVIKTPSTNDLVSIARVDIGSAAIALEDENTSSDSVFFRWPVDNIANLSEGMVLDPARSGTGANTTTPAFISKYQTTTSTTQVVESDFENEIKNINIIKVDVPAVDSYNNPVTTVDRNGRITAQAGNIIFNVQQADALKSDINVKIYAYGNSGIKRMTGMDVDIRDVTITSSQVSTTTSGAVDNSTTIGLAEVGNVSAGMTVRGVGINASVVNPTVVSKSTTSGAGNIVVSSAQTLESGQTLFFDGGTNSVVIKGTIEVKQMTLANEKIYFDLERFLSAS